MNEYQEIVNGLYELAIAVEQLCEREITEEEHNMILGAAIRGAQQQCKAAKGARS